MSEETKCPSCGGRVKESIKTYTLADGELWKEPEFETVERQNTLDEVLEKIDRQAENAYVLREKGKLHYDWANNLKQEIEDMKEGV